MVMQLPCNAARRSLPSAKAARFQTAIQQYGLMLDQIQKALIEGRPRHC